VGTAVRLGGRARDEFDAAGARFGRGEREGGGERVLMERSGGWATGNELRRCGPRPPEARWIEFMAGNAGSEDDVGLSFVVKLRRAEALPAAGALVTLGGAEVVDAEGTLNGGGGGGGIALRSRSAFVSSSWLSSSLEPAFGGGVAVMSFLS
jgi:hypothetical protein